MAVPIEEIKYLRAAGKKGWAMMLMEYVQPLLDQGYTYDGVSRYLAREYDIEISAQLLIEKQYYRRHKWKKKNQAGVVDEPSSKVENSANVSPPSYLIPAPQSNIQPTFTLGQKEDKTTQMEHQRAQHLEQMLADDVQQQKILHYQQELKRYNKNLDFHKKMGVPPPTPPE